MLDVISAEYVSIKNALVVFKLWFCDSDRTTESIYSDGGIVLDKYLQYMKKRSKLNSI